MTATEKLLRELIALPSVNPAFLPVGDRRAGEKQVADFLAASAARAGLDVEFRDVAPGRKNLLVRVAPSGKVRRRILLAPHMDTVNAAESQFTPRTRNGRLHGIGACDTKGSIAAMFSALCDLAHKSFRPAQTEIFLAGLVDEENGQLGSRALADSGFKADLAIVGEPTQLKVVTAHKGSLWLRLQTRGRSAHGSQPELGRNAVHEMARVVDLLETTYASQLRRRRHSLLGPASVNVGAIHGGVQANIVPDACQIMVDRRTLPGETQRSVCRDIRSLLKRHRLKAVIDSGKLAPCLPMETDPRLPLVRQFLQLAGQTRPLGVHYFCDASVLHAAGIPSVVFGPGNIAQAHTADEWISLKSLEMARALLFRFLTALN